MKTTYLLLCVIFGINCYSQNNLNQSINFETNLIGTSPNQNKTESHNTLQSTDLVYDCNTVFWTVNLNGEIMQWDLSADQVTGGTIVATGCGHSLAYCGTDNNLTFYSFNYMAGFKRYDNATSSWITIAEPINTDNIGGYNEHIYFFSLGNSALYYYDGTNANLIPDSSLSLGFYQVADIAVDSLGRAWVFTGSSSTLEINTVKVFDINGLVASYNINIPISANGCYGSFFLNDQLYIGRNDNLIIPININGTVASTGTNISFPYGSFLDLASCNKPSALQTTNHDLGNLVTIYPNPAKDVINIVLNENILILLVYSIDGKLLKTVHDTKSIEISDLATSTYLLKIVSENNVYNKFIIKN